MPQIIPLQNIPNQKFSVQLDENYYNFDIYSTSGAMSFDLSRNGVVLLTGFRIVSGSLWLRYPYLEDFQGNFFLRTLNNSIADYTQFGISQNLIYLSNAELIAIRAAEFVVI
jgi:hypothetical protein